MIENIAGLIKNLELQPYRVKYPKEFSEFEIQSFLFQKLRERGYNVRGEVAGTKKGKKKNTENNKSLGKESIGKGERERVRFDLVVFNEQGIALWIIEVKKNPRWGRRKYKKRRWKLLDKEISRYEKWGLPVDLVQDMEGAESYLENLSVVGPSQHLLSMRSAMQLKQKHRRYKLAEVKGFESELRTELMRMECELLTRYHGRGDRIAHWFINREGKRLLDYWPRGGKYWCADTSEKGLVDGWKEIATIIRKMVYPST